VRRLFTLVAMALPAAASAATFDFTTLGANNTLLPNTVVVGGVTARGFQTNLSTPAALWLRNQTNDHGLGVCSEGASCATGGGDVNELDNAGTPEFIVLERPNGTHWTQLWVSSLDNGGSGGSEEGMLVWGNSLAELAAGTNSFLFGWPNFGASVEGNILALGAAFGFDPNALYVMFTHPAGAGDNNDYLVWRGAYNEGRFLVPEPGTLALLGAALAFATLRRRARR
jgi:PEP-CTERM motif